MSKFDVLVAWRDKPIVDVGAIPPFMGNFYYRRLTHVWLVTPTAGRMAKFEEEEGNEPVRHRLRLWLTAYCSGDMEPRPIGFAASTFCRQLAGECLMDPRAMWCPPIDWLTSSPAVDLEDYLWPWEKNVVQARLILPQWGMKTFDPATPDSLPLELDAIVKLALMLKLVK